VRALNTHPLKSIKKGVGDRDLAVTFGGVTFDPVNGSMSTATESSSATSH
jgi:hypothetical protein